VAQVHQSTIFQEGHELRHCALFSTDTSRGVPQELLKLELEKSSSPETTSAPSCFLDSVRSFRGEGKQTLELEQGGISFFTGEFWTARQRQGHRLHEVSYRACFKPQLPEFFISRLTKPGQVVYDPFMGRGTTVLQAALMNRKGVGVDINPLSILLTKPRLSPPCLREIEERLLEIDLGTDIDTPEDLLVFFHPKTLRALCNLRSWFSGRSRAGEIDSVDEWILMVALNRLTGHSSGFFSVYTLPPNQAVSVKSQRKINEKRNQIPPERDVRAIILKKSRILLKDGVPNSKLNHRLHTASASDAHMLPDGSVDLIVTSPPFMDIVQYSSDNWMRLWFSDIDPSSISIAMHKSEEDWRKFIFECFSDFARVVRPGGKIAFEVGEIRGGKVNLESLVISAVEGLPFDVMGVLVNSQQFTKTANIWGVSNNIKGTNTNRIVVLERNYCGC